MAVAEVKKEEGGEAPTNIYESRSMGGIVGEEEGISINRMQSPDTSPNLILAARLAQPLEKPGSSPANTQSVNSHFSESYTFRPGIQIRMLNAIST